MEKLHWKIEIIVNIIGQFLNHEIYQIKSEYNDSQYHYTIEAYSEDNLNEKIKLPDDYADTIVSLSVMEHLCEPQIFLNESYRILKDGGIMILQVPWMWWIHELPHDYFRYTPYGLKYMFEKAGYKDIQVQPTTGFFSMWFLKMNYFSLKWIKGSKIRRALTKAFLIPFWYTAQKLAPWLDSKHRGWSLESAGFFVVAKK